MSLLNGTNTFTAIAEDAYGRWDTNVITVTLPATASYTYDANGNLTSDGKRYFTYDDENQLTAIEVPAQWKTVFSYDGLGRKRSRTEHLWFNGAWAINVQESYLYDGRLVIQDRKFDDEPLVTYTRGLDLSGSLQGAGGIGGLLMRTKHDLPGPQHAFYHADGSGNVTTMLGVKQQVMARYLYDPFGNTVAASGPLAELNHYRFASKEYHENSGLYNFGLRFYEPNLQRWLNGDPLREGGGVNVYEFVGNGVINTYDPWGMDFAVTKDRLVAFKYGIPYWIGREGYEPSPADIATDVPHSLATYTDDDGKWMWGWVYTVPDRYANLAVPYASLWEDEGLKDLTADLLMTVVGGKAAGKAISTAKTIADLVTK